LRVRVNKIEGRFLMAAHITVVSGIAANTDHRIAQEVLRIGGDPACEISLPDPGLPLHAATLEHRDDGYVVYNRGGVAIRLDNVVILPRGFRNWQPGQTLKLNEAVSLKLEFREESAPVRPAVPISPASNATPTKETARHGANASAAKGKRTQQYAILAVIGVLFAGVMLMDSPSPEKAETNPRGSKFTELLADLQKEARAGDPAADAVRQLLQEGRIAQVRGDQARARFLYGRVLDSLLSRRDAAGNFSRSLDQQLWAFASTAMQGGL
jgi:hypothetical protein